MEFQRWWVFKSKLFGQESTILSKRINLEDHYLLKTFFSKLNFWINLLSKITPNFWQTVITRRNFLKIFPWWHVDSWPKSLLFRTHHLWNSTTELILTVQLSLVFLHGHSNYFIYNLTDKKIQKIETNLSQITIPRLIQHCEHSWNI